MDKKYFILGNAGAGRQTDDLGVSVYFHSKIIERVFQTQIKIRFEFRVIGIFDLVAVRRSVYDAR